MAVTASVKDLLSLVEYVWERAFFHGIEVGQKPTQAGVDRSVEVLKEIKNEVIEQFGEVIISSSSSDPPRPVQAKDPSQ